MNDEYDRAVAVKTFIPEAMLACTDDEKRAFAAAYWMGVCVGELERASSEDCKQLSR